MNQLRGHYSIGVLGAGFSLPEKVVTNYDLEKTLDTSHEWIFNKIGITERRIAADGEKTSDLAIQACRQALKNSSCSADEIDLIILATATPDVPQPNTSCLLQRELKAFNAMAMDVNAVCSGFVFALATAYSLINTFDHYKKALVVGADTFSRILDWSDRKTCVFFGDGAGAVVLGEVEPGFGIQSAHMLSDGSGFKYVHVLAGGSEHPPSLRTVKQGLHAFKMDGKAVWDFAVREFPKSVRHVLDEAALDIGDIDWLIPHQANINIIQQAASDLGISMNQVYTNIHQYGNTAGASIALALAEADEKHLLKKGQNIMLSGFGGGLNVGSLLMKWAI